MTLNPQDELLERARKVIRELREKLSAAEARNRSEPIAIIGMGIRFPGCGSDQNKFWQMIVEGRDAVTSVPPDRWDRNDFHASEFTPGKINTRRGAFLDDVRRFDAAFFDVTPREAARLDPQQRIFLETAWHALEDAGLPKASVAGTATGVFVGVHSHSADYNALQFEDLANLDAYALTGTAHDMIAGRLAYWLDLHGPAVAVNTACSSSLTAVHFATRSLRAGDCTTALVGGVNLLLTPGTTVAAAQLQLLSADGRCKTFDARADGMGRGEGCGAVVLKKLDDALRDGNRVLAIIRGSAVNQDGRTNGLTAPSGLAQQSLLRSALKDAGVEPWEIGYVEAHGTGTALGDPIEVEALAAVLGGARREQPCTLGAVKANLGHLEGAAGIAGLIKAVMVLRRRWLPPVANLEKLNPHLALDGTGLRIPQHGVQWTTSRRLAGISSFGFSGTNVHVVLEEAPAPAPADTTAGEWPVLVSAQSPEALRILALAYAERLEHANSAELANISYTSAVQRTHHAYRIAVMGSDPKAMAAELRVLATSPLIEVKSPRMANSGSQHLNERMRGWIDGAEVDWSTTFPARASVVDLPLYPFQGKPYWLSEASASSATATSFPQEWLYSTEWIEKPLVLSQVDASAQATTWLLFHTEKEPGESLAAAARQRGHRVIEVRRGSRFARESKDEFVLGDDFAEGIKEILAELALDGVQPHLALYLAGSKDAAALTAEAIELAKAVILSGNSLTLWFVTSSSDSIAQPAATHRDQAALRGFSRVFGLEHPELDGGVIDVDSFCEDNLNAVCEEVTLRTGEDRVALRNGSRWIARLRRDRLTPKPEPLKLRTDRCYLVTGAFGRLGMKIASWLVDCGARHLALVGRRDPSEMGDPMLIAQLETWRAQGITVMAEACDVAQESQVRGLLSKIESSGAVLAGVIHAAAGFCFSPIEEATRRDVDLVFRAKVEGARVLDRCTRGSPLDVFVLFGSAAATIGLRNGALYAAANSSLDGIRAQRQAERLPVLLVEWGWWEGAGANKESELVAGSGFGAMQPVRALRALGALITSGRTTGLLADIDWTVLGPALEMRGRQALIEGLLGETTSVAKPADVPRETAWLDDLRDLPAQERWYQLLDFVGEAARQIFGMSPQDLLDEERGLFQMGMDSLMSVRLKRRLEAGTGLRLPGTLTLTYPTISALARYLEEKLFTAEVHSNGASAAPVKPEKDKFSSGDQTVGHLNDSEVDEAIAAELAAIQQKLGAL